MLLGSVQQSTVFETLPTSVFNRFDIHRLLKMKSEPNGYILVK